MPIAAFSCFEDVAKPLNHTGAIGKRLTKTPENALETASEPGTFENISPPDANSRVLHVQTQPTDVQSFIPSFIDMCNFRTPKNRFFGPRCHDLFCRKGLLGSRRGRFRRATGRLLQCNGRPARTPGGPYGRTAASPSCSKPIPVVLKRNFHLSPIFAQQCLQKTTARCGVVSDRGTENLCINEGVSLMFLCPIKNMPL